MTGFAAIQLSHGIELRLRRRRKVDDVLMAPTAAVPQVAAAQPRGTVARSLARWTAPRQPRSVSSIFMPIAPRSPPAGKPAAPVVCLDGLCAAVRLTPHRPAPHAVLSSDLRHASGCADRDLDAADATRTSAPILSSLRRMRADLGARCHPSRRRCKSSRLAGITRRRSAINRAAQPLTVGEFVAREGLAGCAIGDALRLRIVAPRNRLVNAATVAVCAVANSWRPIEHDSPLKSLARDQNEAAGGSMCPQGIADDR